MRTDVDRPECQLCMRLPRLRAFQKTRPAGASLFAECGEERRVGRRNASLPAQPLGRFLETFAGLKCLPDAEQFRSAQVAGPCATFSAEDTWSETPFNDGVVRRSRRVDDRRVFTSAHWPGRRAGIPSASVVAILAPAATPPVCGTWSRGGTAAARAIGPDSRLEQERKWSSLLREPAA